MEGAIILDPQELAALTSLQEKQKEARARRSDFEKKEFRPTDISCTSALILFLGLACFCLMKSLTSDHSTDYWLYGGVGSFVGFVAAGLYRAYVRDIVSKKFAQQCPNEYKLLSLDFGKQ